MKQEFIVIDLWKAVAMTTTISYMLLVSGMLTRVIIVTLVLLSVFILQYLLERIGHRIKNYNKKLEIKLNLWKNGISIICIILIILLGAEEFMPILAVLLISLISSAESWQKYFILTFLTFIILVLILDIKPVLVIVSLVTMAGTDSSLYLAGKLYRSKEKSQTLSIENRKLEERIKDNEQLMKSIRYAAALEERNRMAVRLHDKIGHNISGSILMLEAAMLQMESNQEKAIDEVNRAVEHLRHGVDELRHALREERPVRSDINANQIHLQLEQAKLEHNLYTHFITEGNLDIISPEIWKCIHDNLTEILTNTYKHSKATSFTLSIKVMPSMIRVMFVDNGPSASEFTKGIGLEAVEERTVRCSGRCFFEASELGFKITNVFMADKLERGSL